MNDKTEASNVVKLKSNFNVLSKHEAFYTGGKIQFSATQDVVFCSCGEKIKIINVESGKVSQTISEESDEISCFAVSPDDEILITCSKNLLLKQWDWKNERCTRSWKAVNKGPLSCMKFDATSTLLAAGSSDSTIKIWDVEKQYYTHNFKGSQGVISVIYFHKINDKLQLFSAADDCKIRIWDLQKSRCVSVLEGHFSVITSLAFPEDNVLISSGRDNVINIWDLPNRKLLKTIPLFESIESVLMLPEDVNIPNVLEMEKSFLTCGHKGIIKIYDFMTHKCVYETTVHDGLRNGEKEASTYAIVHAELCPNINCVAVVTADHNIILFSLEAGLKKVKQFVGYNDEILDMQFLGSSEDMAVVATNSSQVRLYDLKTMDCHLLSAHSDIVLCLDAHTSGEMMVTGSKDNTIRLWKKDEDRGMKCIAVGQGHTHVVSCVSLPRIKTSFVVSGSQDLTIKVWSTEIVSEDNNVSNLSVLLTEKGHDKDINSITVSPNDKLIASGSQDKTVKIWRRSDLTLLGTLRGHKRGVWCVQFSPIDQCLASSSGDAMIRLWALSDFTCLKTLEGHSNSVLQIVFVSRGMQLMSSDSDGLIKLWTIKTSECLKTLDEHNDKIWSLALSNSEERMLSGGVDSVLNIWKDVTEEEEETARMAVEDQLMKEQELSNLLQRKHFTKAISLALTLEQPLRTLNVIKEILFEDQGQDELSRTLQNLKDYQIDALLKFLCDWNTNAKHSRVSQLVLSMILKQHPPNWLVERPEMRERIQALLPYTERHLERMNRLLQQSMFLEYTWQSMKLGTATDDNANKIGKESQMTSIEEDG
ncbi:transducin beta-like protein 3 [Dendronephthya gigantea]|uniref:transducin beta-like protein 3 n=1 Tax=Dendronephthya gigantea TaxID=151771 RepID=UPI00106C7A75|nr:transducin beta-like protein 3 [Dendronephthya gigantea]